VIGARPELAVSAEYRERLLSPQSDERGKEPSSDSLTKELQVAVGAFESVAQ
jgi:hypothetical protein